MSRQSASLACFVYSKNNNVSFLFDGPVVFSKVDFVSFLFDRPVKHVASPCGNRWSQICRWPPAPFVIQQVNATRDVVSLQTRAECLVGQSARERCAAWICELGFDYSCQF